MQQCIQNLKQFRFPVLLGETNCLQFLPHSRIEPIQLYQLGIPRFGRSTAARGSCPHFAHSSSTVSSISASPELSLSCCRLCHRWLLSFFLAAGRGAEACDAQVAQSTSHARLELHSVSIHCRSDSLSHACLAVPSFVSPQGLELHDSWALPTSHVLGWAFRWHFSHGAPARSFSTT